MLWRLTLVVFSLLFTPYFDAVQSIYVTTSQSYVVVNIGNNATLHCSYKTVIDSQFTLEWRFTPGPNENALAEKILYYTAGETYKLGPQANRIRLVDQEPTKGDASIIIENTKSSDTGRYSCDINNPPDFTGISEAFVNLIVQVPPSIPKCKVIGKPYIGNNVTLSCSSTVGRPTPRYKWSQVSSPTATSSPRITVKAVDSKKGTLILRNLTVADSGVYKCLSSNVLGEQSCQLVLSVTVNNDVGVIVGALFGILVAVILIVIVTYYLLHRGKKTKESQIGHELREDAVAPGKETNTHLLASSAPNEGTGPNSMNSKYNIVV